LWWGTPALNGYTPAWRFWGYTLLDRFLMANKTSASGVDIPGRTYAVDWLKNRYQSNITAFNVAWYMLPPLSLSLSLVRHCFTQERGDDRSASYPTFDDVRGPNFKNTTAHRNDSADFAYLAAVKFFNTTRNGSYE
jgi:hypothetical protein